MPSSRLTDDGRCVVTTPASWCSPGYAFRVVASSATYGIGHADWVLRLLQPSPAWTGRVTEVDWRPAEAALVEQLRSGELHPALVAEPPAPA
jgi:hypothetical protein